MSFLFVVVFSLPHLLKLIKSVTVCRDSRQLSCLSPSLSLSYSLFSFPASYVKNTFSLPACFFLFVTQVQIMTHRSSIPVCCSWFFFFLLLLYNFHSQWILFWRSSWLSQRPKTEFIGHSEKTFFFRLLNNLSLPSLFLSLFISSIFSKVRINLFCCFSSNLLLLLLLLQNFQWLLQFLGSVSLHSWYS